MWDRFSSLWRSNRFIINPRRFYISICKSIRLFTKLMQRPSISHFLIFIVQLQQQKQPVFSIDDLKAVLSRRGPDSLGCKSLLLQSGHQALLSSEEGLSTSDDQAQLLFIGATLQLRGLTPIIQPLTDASNNLLVYNGNLI